LSFPFLQRRYRSDVHLAKRKAINPSVHKTRYPRHKRMLFTIINVTLTTLKRNSSRDDARDRKTFQFPHNENARRLTRPTSSNKANRQSGCRVIIASLSRLCAFAAARQRNDRDFSRATQVLRCSHFLRERSRGEREMDARGVREPR